jgi:hypothetical protein
MTQEGVNSMAAKIGCHHLESHNFRKNCDENERSERLGDPDLQRFIATAFVDESAAARPAGPGEDAARRAEG